MDNKNLEEIQDQIAICAKSETKVQKINASPNRKGEKQPKQQFEKSNCLKKKKVIPKFTM